MIRPQNFEEKLVWYTVIGTYGLYLLGAQLIWVPALAWFLGLYLCKKLWDQTEDTPNEKRITIPAVTWVWVVSMLVMEFALIMAHLDWDLGVDRLIRSTLVWGRSWALMALLPLAGCLNIRPQLIYRAACILCIQSFVIILICYTLYLLHIPSFSYVSPLRLLVGGSPYDFSVGLFGVDPDNNHQFRLNLFTPFYNTLGITGALYFCLVCQESDKKLRWISMFTAATMVFGSASRLTMFCIVVVPVLNWILTNFTWPLQIATGIVSFFGGLFASPIIDFAENSWDLSIKRYRVGSERIRSKLKQIALERWPEAPIWGHGAGQEHGPKSTEGIPIGTHNQWPDLLYLKGIVGFTAFLVPLLWSFTVLLVKAQKSSTAKAGLSIILVILICTSGADLEVSVYHWPCLVLLGIAFKEKTELLAGKLEKNEAPV